MAKEEKAVLEEIEETAGEQLGVEQWDRPAIFRESATAATDGDLPYWMVLVLSGAIATLGLALNSSAVVIGAMLIAPLLAPVVGLALALAVGDGRLALQTAAVVLLSTIAVVTTGALLTAILPFQTITLEITARTRPTTLDLAIAVFSGLAGAVVTVARGKRLSAAIPGVAISVALIPPLAVAGFGIGAGWNAQIIRGSLLLYGANLAGIVLSGMLVFLIIGMHRENVLETARRWHRGEGPTGVIAWVDRLSWVRRLGIIRSTSARVGLVVAFVVALAIPLSTTLEEIARETRVRRAVDDAAELFNVPGRSSILGQQVLPGADQTQVYLRVATTEWFGEEAKQQFERSASAAAGEPVLVVLTQLPATGGDIARLAALLPSDNRPPAALPEPTAPAQLPDLVASIRRRLDQALAVLPLPDGVAIAGAELAVEGGGTTSVRIGYTAPAPLPVQAEQILARQLTAALGDPELVVRMTPISTTLRPLAAADTARIGEIADLLRRYDGVGAEIVAGQQTDSAQIAAAVGLLSGLGVAPGRITTRRDGDEGLRLGIRAIWREGPGEGARSGPPG
jgi:uncharacterized hydrophobic protein (TIGR00271 family)